MNDEQAFLNQITCNPPDDVSRRCTAAIRICSRVDLPKVAGSPKKSTPDFSERNRALRFVSSVRYWSSISYDVLPLLTSTVRPD
jgi:hypothetical protein